MSRGFKAIQSYLPWVKSPLIVNAPMAIFAGTQLATAVTKAGGHGQIGTANDAGTLEKQLAEVQTNFEKSSLTATTTTLPISIGLLVFLGKLDTLLPVIAKYRPAVIWLFAASLDDYSTWATQLRAASPASKIWIQTGSVAAALKLATGPAKADALIIQGADAGGHGYEHGAGFVSVLPETLDALAAAGQSHIPVLASGGIVDARGVAAALCLGAAGVVMGTRFLAASETVVHPSYQKQILTTKDGGQTTTRAKLFDELNGPNPWPVEYDGRALMGASYDDHRAGVHIDEIRRLYALAVTMEHGGFGSGGAESKDEKVEAGVGTEEKGRAAVWMGSAVGLVNKVQPAGEIVEEVREGARKALRDALENL